MAKRLKPAKYKFLDTNPPDIIRGIYMGLRLAHSIASEYDLIGTDSTCDEIMNDLYQSAEDMKSYMISRGIVIPS